MGLSSKAELPDFDVYDHPRRSASLKMLPLVFDSVQMLLHGIEERVRGSAKRDPTQAGEPLLLKALIVEVFIQCHKDALSRERRKRDDLVRRVSRDVEALACDTMATSL